MRSRVQNNVRRMVFVCVILALGLVLVIASTPVKGQETKFPSKPIEVIIPFSPGGLVDVGARIFVESLSRGLKVPVIIRNQSGAGGLTGSTAFLNTRPDGYTLLATGPSSIITSVLQSKTPPFDPRKDLLPVAYFAESPIAIAVSKTSPLKSFHDFLQFAKSDPGKLKGAVTPQGAEPHMMLMGIIKDTKIEIKIIPYTSMATLLPAFLGGHVDFMSHSFASILPYVKSGDARILLLTRPWPELPSVPTGPDIGVPSFSFKLWIGFFALPQTPKAAYERLVAAMKTVSEEPETAKKLANAGFVVMYKNPREISNLIDDQWGITSRVLKETGMKVD